MADSIDLNILVRGIQGQAWTAEKGVITAGDLDKVVEQKTNNSGALNALPTPFARFFIFNEAFRRMKEKKLNPKKEAGLAYDPVAEEAQKAAEKEAAKAARAAERAAKKAAKEAAKEALSEE